MLTRFTGAICWSYFAWLFLRQSYVSCRGGHVNELTLNAKFYCDLSQRSVYRVSSEMQCVHECAKTRNCEFLNYRISDDGTDNCEIFRLPPSHKSCKMAKDETHWKALVFEGACHVMKYNYCFPCKCSSICLPNEVSCQCDSVPRLPDIYISFEDSVNSTTVNYTRGKDQNGRSVLYLNNRADVGKTSGRVGNVLRLTDFGAGASLGNFQSHPLNNPNSGKATITLWIKVLSAQPSTQIVFGSGKMNDNTGTLLSLTDFATSIHVENVVSSSSTSLNYFVGDALTTWTHIGLVDYAKPGPSIKLYINGILVAKSAKKVSKNVNSGKFSNFIFGAADKLFPLTGQLPYIHIDDFAVWTSVLSDAEIAYVMTQDHTICVE